MYLEPASPFLAETGLAAVFVAEAVVAVIADRVDFDFRSYGLSFGCFVRCN